ncbi:MAG: ATP-binding protein [Segetibacter sp.]|nr:ATP-binding protein [Segetibacter sp.]
MSKPITIANFLAQLKADLIGKDSYRGVTLTYSWLANQFGHFSLGFVPTLLLYRFLLKKYGFDSAAKWAPIIVAGTWIAFETYNFLGPLLSKKQSKSKLVFVAKKQEPYTFKPAWGNVAFDTITDLGYFSLGAFCCAHIFSQYTSHCIVIWSLIIALLYPSFYWFRTKMFLQVPKFPFQFRLSQWDNSIDEAGADNVKKFLAAKEKDGMQLLVFGTKNSGKTSLAVGIATELSIKKNPSVYTTATKLYSMFAESADPAPEVGFLWGWRGSSVFVIDDINPGEPITEEIVDAKTFQAYLDAPSPAIDNRKAILEKNVIWVLGTLDPEKNMLQPWIDMLKDIGVKEDRILHVDL